MTVAILHCIRCYLPLCCLVLLLAAGCRESSPPTPVERGFYYWRSGYRLDTAEKKLLQDLSIRKLYVKFFDVSWNPQQEAAIPVARLRFNDTGFALPAVVPVVFITNEALFYTDSSRIDQLAVNIASLLFQLMGQTHMQAPAEIQFDCDWTASTKDKYFRLLQQLRQQLQQKGFGGMLSATIRLYQCKFRLKTGVPPVDRGLLMCYNMGDLKDPRARNSILDIAELKKYIGFLGNYPLPMDAALPLFDWKVLFRNNQYTGLVRNLPSRQLENAPYITAQDNRFTFLEDTTVNGYQFMKGDVLRDEQSRYEDLLEAAGLLNRFLKNNHSTVILYQLDATLTAKYSVHEMETVFDRFD